MPAYERAAERRCVRQALVPGLKESINILHIIEICQLMMSTAPRQWKTP